MSLNKLFIVFGIILVIFAGVVFYQFRSNSNTRTGGAAQSTNKNATARINNKTFKLEIADTPAAQQKGLSGRDSLAQDQGMLFVFDKADYYSFWMKNMKFPIDIIFIRGDKIVSISKNAVAPKSADASLPIYKPEAPVDKVLEINSGLSDKHNIKKGDKVEIKL
jgi:uncharacterized protein